MTDEEKAIDYTDNTHIKYNEILSRPEVVDEIRKVYLAGFKAGRPQWHKVADGDYPPYDKCNCSINVLTNSGHIAYYNYDDECWIEVFSVIEINPPIAWCEIPKYTEE